MAGNLGNPAKPFISNSAKPFQALHTARKVVSGPAAPNQLPASNAWAMNALPCFKALSEIGRMRGLGGSCGRCVDPLQGMARFRKLGAFGAWQWCVLLIARGVSPAAIAHDGGIHPH